MSLEFLGHNEHRLNGLRCLHCGETLPVMLKSASPSFFNIHYYSLQQISHSPAPQIPALIYIFLVVNNTWPVHFI